MVLGYVVVVHYNSPNGLPYVADFLTSIMSYYMWLCYILIAVLSDTKSCFDLEIIFFSF
jgi:hypothetical protein